MRTYRIVWSEHRTNGRVGRRRATAVVVVAVALAASRGQAVRAAELSWTGGGDGFTWLDENNWADDMGVAPAVPPGTSDDVVIPSMAMVEVNGPAGAATLEVSDALLKVLIELTIAGSAAVDRLQLHGDLINHDTLMIQGNSEWKNGRFLGSGNVENKGTLTVDGGIPRLIQAKLFRNEGSMNVETQIQLESATFENSGMLTLDSSSISQRGLTPSQLTNTGTINSDGVDAGTIAVPLRNLGGTLRADVLTSLEITRRAEIQGGQLVVDDGTICFEGSEDHLFSGEVAASGRGWVALRNPLENSGTLTNNLTGDIGLNLQSRLYGSGNLVNNGVMTWESGRLELTGDVVNNSATLLQGNVTLATTFRNQLSTAQLSGSLTLAPGAEWVNEVGSQYTLQQGAGASIFISGEGTYINRGTLVKNRPNGVSIASRSSHEGGNIDVDEGELRIRGESQHTGSGVYTVQSGASLLFDDQNHTFAGQHRIAGDGSFRNQAPSTLTIQGGSSLTIALSDDGDWRITGDVRAAGELINDTSTKATWVNGTMDVDNSGVFINDGELIIDVGNSQTLVGGGRLLNRSFVNQFRGLSLSGSGGGIENEGLGTWQQDANLTFLSGSSGKTVNNAGTWSFTGDSTIYNPGGILANNTFRNTGELAVLPSVQATIHASFVAEDSSITLLDAIASPPPAIIKETALSLTGGGQFINSPVSLGSESRLDLTGTGGTKTYLFMGENAKVDSGGKLAQLNIGQNARIVAATELNLSVGGDVTNPELNYGAVLNGGTLAGGDIVNKDLFYWRSGEIATHFLNRLNTVVGTSSSHLVTGGFTNGVSGELYQTSSITLDSTMAPEPVIVTNRNYWFMGNGARFISRQGSQSLLFVNEGLLLVGPDVPGMDVVAVIDVPMDNQGTVHVEGLFGDSATLDLRTSTGVVDPLGTLQSGRWLVGRGGAINFPRPIEVIAPDASIEGNYPDLSDLEIIQGALKVPLGDVDQGLTNTGNMRFGALYESKDGGEVQSWAAGVFQIEGDLFNGGLFDSAVDESDNDRGSRSSRCDGCTLPDVAVDVGDHQFINSGIVRPGGEDDAGSFPLIGDFLQQSAGVLEVDLNGDLPIVDYDQTIIYGQAQLGGTLDVRLLGAGLDQFAPAAGDQFDLITVTEMLQGEFEQVLLPQLSEGLGWELRYGAATMSLLVALVGDFNHDGLVDGEDFLIWQSNFNTGGPHTTSTGDANGDGLVDGQDFLAWQSHFGNVAGGGSSTNVPEPTAAWLLVLAASTLAGVGRVANR